MTESRAYSKVALQGHESPTESRYAPSEASVSSVPEDLSLEDDAHSRVTSNSHASSSRGTLPVPAKESACACPLLYKSSVDTVSWAC